VSISCNASAGGANGSTVARSLSQSPNCCRRDEVREQMLGAGAGVGAWGGAVIDCSTCATKRRSRARISSGVDAEGTGEVGMGGIVVSSDWWIVCEDVAVYMPYMGGGDGVG
jgi:hypothetical protein